MKSIEHLLSTQELTKTFKDWQIINPLLYARQLNRLLSTKEIQREFHRCALAYSAVRRWEILEHTNFSYYPKPPQPQAGGAFLTMAEMDSCDWRWDLGPGRPPLYLTQTCHGSCHWRGSGDLEVARRLMPELDWVVVSAEKHTAVMAPAEQLIWDPTYAAMEVTAQSALDTIFGDDLGGTDYQVYEPEEFEWTDHTKYILKIWELVDGYPEDKRLKVIKGMGSQLDEIRSGDVNTGAVLIAT